MFTPLFSILYYFSNYPYYPPSHYYKTNESHFAQFIVANYCLRHLTHCTFILSLSLFLSICPFAPCLVEPQSVIFFSHYKIRCVLHRNNVIHTWTQLTHIGSVWYWSFCLCGFPLNTIRAFDWACMNVCLCVCVWAGGQYGWFTLHSVLCGSEMSTLFYTLMTNNWLGYIILYYSDNMYSLSVGWAKEECSGHKRH